MFHIVSTPSLWYDSDDCEWADSEGDDYACGGGVSGLLGFQGYDADEGCSVSESIIIHASEKKPPYPKLNAVRVVPYECGIHNILMREVLRLRKLNGNQRKLSEESHTYHCWIWITVSS